MTFDLGVNVTQNVAQYPLHYVTYSATKFEVATSNRLGGDTITRKYNIWPLTLTLGSRSHEMLPSTLYIMWPIQLQSLKLLPLTVKEEIHLQETWRTDVRTDGRTDGRPDGRRTDFDTKLIYPFFLKKKAGVTTWLQWSQHKQSSSHVVILMTKETVRGQITKKYMEVVGMASQTLISKVKEFWKMHCHKTCSSVTRVSRNVTVTSSHKGQVIQQPR